MRALVLCDDSFHPAATVRRGLDPLRGDGFEFDWIEAGGLPVSRMLACPAVIISKMNQLSAADQRPWADTAAQEALVDYVRRGNGLLMIHSGTAGYQDAPAIRALAGGAFLQHPPQCTVRVELRRDHPLAAGAAPFEVHDEHYFMELDDSAADMFLTTTSEHGTQPGGWTRSVGAGRVCVLTPGHNLEVWLDPSYQALIRNALSWCGSARLGGSSAPAARATER